MEKAITIRDSIDVIGLYVALMSWTKGKELKQIESAVTLAASTVNCNETNGEQIPPFASFE